jgi:hypothetical protein
MVFWEDIYLGRAAGNRGAESSEANRSGRYLFGPTIDFLCLGGGSLILLPVLLVLPLDPFHASIGQALLYASFLVNYPHFANSYQLFYRRYHRKAFSCDLDATLRARYVFAGIIVPLALSLFFVGSVMSGNALMLGFAANLMALLVGWHYVKQGYGILMVDAAKKRRFFQETEKRIFRVNGYVVWLLAWLVGNRAFSQQEMLNLHYYTFETPVVVLVAVSGLAVATGTMTVISLMRCWWSNGGSLPYNGIFAYVASLYFWFLFMRMGIDPVWLMVVPALHSLQYLLIVWRYQIGYEKDRPGGNESLFSFVSVKFAGKKYQLNLAMFILLGVIIGAVGFWVMPTLLKVVVPYDTETFGPSMFMFIFFIFINVHHFFMDNVMWRRDNPDVRKYLFN